MGPVAARPMAIVVPRPTTFSDQLRGPPESRLLHVAAVHRFVGQRQHIRPESDPGHWLMIPVGSSLEPEAFIEAVGRLHSGRSGDRDAAPPRGPSPGDAGANERLSYAASPGLRCNAEHPKPAWGSETPIRSRGGAVVLMDEAAEQVPAANVARTDRDRVSSPGQW